MKSAIFMLFLGIKISINKKSNKYAKMINSYIYFRLKLIVIANPLRNSILIALYEIAYNE